MKRTIFVIAALAAAVLPMGAVLAQSDGNEPVKPPTGEDARSQQSAPPTTGTAAAIPTISGTIEQSGTDPQTSGTDPIIPVPHMSK